MDKKNLSEGQQKLLAMFLFYFLLFSYPLLSFLWRRSYPMFATETLAIFAILAASCLILAFLLVRVRPWIVSVFSALLITATFIVQFNLLLAGLVICAVVCLCAAWWLGTRFHLYGLPVLALLILGALVDSFADDGERVALRKPVGLDQQLPPVVHIILDSFAGMEGFPPYESSGVIRNEVYSFFNYYNFQVFPRAYSPYTQTGDSLYSALNFENKSETGFGLEVFNRKAHVMKSNA